MIATTPVANPSRPSVKFTAFVVPNNINAVNNIKIGIPSDIGWLNIGIIIDVPKLKTNKYNTIDYYFSFHEKLPLNLSRNI